MDVQLLDFAAQKIICGYIQNGCNRYNYVSGRHALPIFVIAVSLSCDMKLFCHIFLPQTFLQPTEAKIFRKIVADHDIPPLMLSALYQSWKKNT